MKTRDVLLRLSTRIARDFIVRVPADWDDEKTEEAFWDYAIDAEKDCGGGIVDQVLSIVDENMDHVPSGYPVHAILDEDDEDDEDGK